MACTFLKAGISRVSPQGAARPGDVAKRSDGGATPIAVRTIGARRILEARVLFPPIQPGRNLTQSTRRAMRSMGEAVSWAGSAGLLAVDRPCSATPPGSYPTSGPGRRRASRCRTGVAVRQRQAGRRPAAAGGRKPAKRAARSLDLSLGHNYPHTCGIQHRRGFAPHCEVLK